jgi:hypothetical protein
VSEREVRKQDLIACVIIFFKLLFLSLVNSLEQATKIHVKDIVNEIQL